MFRRRDPEPEQNDEEEEVETSLPPTHVPVSLKQAEEVRCPLVGCGSRLALSNSM